MTKRSYDQYCPVAASLDVLGERWTLLIVRELLGGPRRYTDIRQALPGMWPNLLAARLAELEGHGVVRQRELPAPAARTVYELTEDGRRLEDVLSALARWGMSRLAAPGDGEQVPVPSALRGSLLAWFTPERVPGGSRRYTVVLSGRPFGIWVTDGGGERAAMTVQRGPADDADLVVTADAEDLVRIRLGELALTEAVAERRLVFDGLPAAVEEFVLVFDLATPVAR